MIIYPIKNGFTFCHGEIGKEDFSSYLHNVVMPVDLVYCSTPNPSSINLWFQGREKPNVYENMLKSILDIIMYANPTEAHIECGENRDFVIRYFERRNFRHVELRDIIYSAPIGQMKFAKRETAYSVLSLSNKPIDHLEYTYSHEFIDGLLRHKSKLTCFDPLIGKGLLSMFALKYGHVCHGIDMNFDRLKFAMRYIESNLEQISLF